MGACLSSAFGRGVRGNISLQGKAAYVAWRVQSLDRLCVFFHENGGTRKHKRYILIHEGEAERAYTINGIVDLGLNYELPHDTGYAFHVDLPIVHSPRPGHYARTGRRRTVAVTIFEGQHYILQEPLLKRVEEPLTRPLLPNDTSC